MYEVNKFLKMKTCYERQKYLDNRINTINTQHYELYEETADCKDIALHILCVAVFVFIPVTSTITQKSRRIFKQ